MQKRIYRALDFARVLRYSFFDKIDSEGRLCWNLDRRLRRRYKNNAVPLSRCYLHKVRSSLFLNILSLSKEKEKKWKKNKRKEIFVWFVTIQKSIFFYCFSLKWTIMPIVVRYSSEWKISHSFYEFWINASSIFEINHSVEKKHRVHQEGRDYPTLRCWEPSVRFLSIHDTLILFSSVENLPSFTFFLFSSFLSNLFSLFIVIEF